MRFEIRTLGIAGILVGVLALSGAVFVMGLLAGYDIGHQSQIATQQVAVSYPVPPAPSNAPPPAASEASLVPPSAPPIAHAAPPAPESKTRVASVTKPPVPAASENEDESADNAGQNADEDMQSSPAASPVAKRVASAEAPAASHEGRHKPFNIQIEAAMDHTSAQDMAKRLGALGYEPHLLPTEINGSTWYKVEVGPYTTQEEASSAEAELRKKYNATYGRGGAPAQSNDDNDDQGPEE